MQKYMFYLMASVIVLTACQPAPNTPQSTESLTMNNESLIREMSRDELLQIVGTNISRGTPAHDPVRFATQEELDAMRVDFNTLDLEMMRRTLVAAARVITQQTTVEQEHVAFGKGRYSVPKMDTQPINSWGNSVIYTMRQGGGSVKGFSFGFGRDGTHAPWNSFGLSIDHPYEFTVNVPVNKAFFDELGLVLFKTQENYPCDNASGKCNAFFYTSKKYAQLGYTILTDPGRADLESGVATNFRKIKIEIISTRRV
jgi:hypothetical protein